MAAPVRNADGAVVAALSLVVLRDGASVGALARAVRTAARAVSRALGSTEPIPDVVEPPTHL